MAEQIRIIALDDEPLALEVIKVYSSNIPDLEVLELFTQPIKFLKYSRLNSFDAMILDIQMPSVNGVQFYKEHNFNVPVIFSTSFPNYAVDAFNIQAVDYLLKPYSPERFYQAMQRLRKSIPSSSGSEKVKIKLDHEHIFLSMHEIIYIQAWGDYLKVFLTSGKRLVTRTTMKELEGDLPSNQFIRTHRSYIVAHDHIRKQSSSSLEMIDGTVVPIGRKYKNHIKGR